MLLLGQYDKIWTFSALCGYYNSLKHCKDRMVKEEAATVNWLDKDLQDTANL